VTYFLSFVEFLPLGAMLARNWLSSCVLLSVRPSVRQSQAGIVSKRSTGRIELVFLHAGFLPPKSKGKGSPYSITERTVPELIPVLGSQPAGDLSHKPGGRLPLLSARPAVTPATLKRAASNSLLGEQRHNGCEQFAKDCYPSASRLRFEPGPFCA